MANTDLYFNDNDKEIEDVIDARKKNGQYDVSKPSADVSSALSINHCGFSTGATSSTEEDKQNLLDDALVFISEDERWCFSGEPGFFNIGPTESEITVVRVKREGLQYKNGENRWNLHDDAIPGDGSHLGESPSLVNLVTLVRQSLGNNKLLDCNEYLVPLSSWDPCDHPYKLPGMEGNPKNREEMSNFKLQVFNKPNSVEKNTNLAGRMTHFLRKRCAKKSKPAVDSDNQKQSDQKSKN